jgi:CAAX prenyl protease-like protein
VNRTILAYVLPFVLYLGLVQLPPKFPEHYPLLYGAVVLVVGAVTAGLLWGRGLIRPHRDVAAGVAVGVVGIALWITISGLRWEQVIAAYLPTFLQPGERHGFDPFDEFSSPAAMWAFVVVRIVGLAVLVPVVEELFWRGFLLRWLMSPEFERRELYRFTPSSFVAVTLLFAAAHPEWFAAAVYSALLNGLVYWKRDLWSCIVAHGVSNAILGVYVLSTHSWELW